MTTCKRLDLVKKNIFPLLRFCHKNENFHFILALDGYEEEYIDFCDKWQIPLIYSEDREGVGMSKNRVYTKFPEFDFYFFIDDDAELQDSKIFKAHIEAHLVSNIHYFAVGCKEVFSVKNYYSFKIKHAWKGSGRFNFYTKHALVQVGGWHTHFAKIKRYGHTEHSYRVYYKGLSPAPFNEIEGYWDSFLWEQPEVVTKAKAKIVDGDLYSEEKKMIEEKQDFFPFQTISNFFFNYKSTNDFSQAIEFGRNKKYPFLSKNSKRKAWGQYYIYSFLFSDNKVLNIPKLLLGAFLYPNSVFLKIYINWLIHGK
mgnify:CR=1 FL=1